MLTGSTSLQSPNYKKDSVNLGSHEVQRLKFKMQDETAKAFNSRRNKPNRLLEYLLFKPLTLLSMRAHSTHYQLLKEFYDLELETWLHKR